MAGGRETRWGAVVRSDSLDRQFGTPLYHRPFLERKPERAAAAVAAVARARPGGVVASARATILGLLASLDVEACLRSGGLRDDDQAAVSARLLRPPVA